MRKQLHVPRGKLGKRLYETRILNPFSYGMRRSFSSLPNSIARKQDCLRSVSGSLHPTKLTRTGSDLATELCQKGQPPLREMYGVHRAAYTWLLGYREDVALFLCCRPMWLTRDVDRRRVLSSNGGVLEIEVY